MLCSFLPQIPELSPIGTDLTFTSPGVSLSIPGPWFPTAVANSPSSPGTNLYALDIFLYLSFHQSEPLPTHPCPSLSFPPATSNMPRADSSFGAKNVSVSPPYLRLSFSFGFLPGIHTVRLCIFCSSLGEEASHEHPSQTLLKGKQHSVRLLPFHPPAQWGSEMPHYSTHKGASASLQFSKLLMVELSHL